MLVSARIAFLQAGPALLALTVNALRTHPQRPRGRAAYTTGATERALSFEATDDSLTEYGPAHMQTLITGRGPTSSGASAGEPKLSEILAQWAEDKGIQLTGGITYKTFGFLAARKIHREGTELYNETEPSGLLDEVLTPDFLTTLKARIAAGEMVAISTALAQVLQRP